MNYKSPITMFMSKLDMIYEDEIYKAIQKVGVYVDKEELIKALNYDRHQYEMGYADARKDYEKQLDKVIDLLYEHMDCEKCPFPLNYEKCTIENCKEYLKEMLLKGVEELGL